MLHIPECVDLQVQAAFRTELVTSEIEGLEVVQVVGVNQLKQRFSAFFGDLVDAKSEIY
jgi:hypothetical protein